jgi:Xaa-Pro aminopeptidase
MSDAGSGEAQKDRLLQADFPPEEFAARRARIFQAMGGGAFAVLQGAPDVRGFEVFRQSNQFHYCCGVEVPQAYLLLDAAARRATLYLPHRPARPGAEGELLGAEDAERLCAAAGLDAVCGVELLSHHLQRAAVLYVPHRPAEGWQASRDMLQHADGRAAADPWDGRLSREQHFIQLLRARCPRAEIRDLSVILDGLRAIKSPREIERLRRAGELSAEAVTQAMRATRPGVLEYQLAAVAEHVYRLGGARGESYRAIVAGGQNAWYAHYFRNDCALEDGDLVLVDTAPDYHYYTSDIGRMWPVGGTYAPWQRELYGFMVEYHKALLARIRPGATADEIMDQAAAEMAQVVQRTAFSSETYQAAAQRALEFRGHLSHPVGMAVHDVGGYRSEPLRPGVVFTVDPQMRVPEEKLYIRCEDTVAVTQDGMENLTAAAPLELDDVEALLRQERRPPGLWGDSGRPAQGPPMAAAGEDSPR